MVAPRPYRVTRFSNCTGPALKTEKLGGLTFRLPAREEWAGKVVEFYVMLFGDGVDAARAELHLVTPRERAVERRLQIRSAAASRPEAARR